MAVKVSNTNSSRRWLFSFQPSQMPSMGHVYVFTLPGWQKHVDVISVWGMKWARYISSLEFSWSLMVLKKCMGMLEIWTPWKISTEILSLHSMHSEERAVPCADPFEVCHFPCHTFFFFCTKLTATEKYSIRLVSLQKVTFWPPFYLFFSIHKILFPLFIFLSESEPEWD